MRQLVVNARRDRRRLASIAALGSHRNLGPARPRTLPFADGWRRNQRGTHASPSRTASSGTHLSNRRLKTCSAAEGGPFACLVLPATAHQVHQRLARSNRTASKFVHTREHMQTQEHFLREVAREACSAVKHACMLGGPRQPAAHCIRRATRGAAKYSS